MIPRSENAFSKNYMILKPENASLVELFMFLLPFTSRRRRFVDCPIGTESSLLRKFMDRLLISVSILLQIILLALATPLDKFDSFVVYILNFIYFNRGVLGISFKILRGKKLVKPDKNSPEYQTVVGFSDWRKDLDSSIKPDDSFRYYGALTAMAAKISYESGSFIQSVVNDRWKMKFLGFFDFWNDFQGRATTQAFMFENTVTNVIVVAFRGTSPLDTYDWQVDADFSWYEIEGMGRVHGGFMKAMGLQKRTGWPKNLPTTAQHDFAYYTLRQKLAQIAATKDKAKFIITGHSLGGALATAFVTVLGLHDESAILNKLLAVYTYGQPRVGDQRFAEFMDNIIQKYKFKFHRYVYSSDLVTRLPFDATIFKYKHFGKCVYFNTFYQGKILKESPNKNYFSLVWLIPKYVSAIWELLRSFITPLVRGLDYWESWLMKWGRILALIIPGATAHAPLNYVNSTRLGKLNVPADQHQD